MRSESTSALGQPRLTKPTLGWTRDIRRYRNEGARIIPPTALAPELSLCHRLRGGAMKGHSISLMTPNGRISAWRADPPIPPRGAIVVIQEIFGVNAHIRGVVERFAAHGYTAIAPALFDHFGHKIELAYDEEGVAKGRELVDKLGFDKAVSD